MKKQPKFKRSVDANIEYYRKRSISEKLKETIELSDFCLKFASAADKAGFHGKKSIS